MIKESKIHYSWFVMLAGTLAFFCTCGMTINIFAVYQPLIGKAFGYSQTQLTFLVTLKAVGQLTVTPFIVKIYSRISLRKGMCIGFAMGIIPYFVFALVPCYAVFALGILMLGASSLMAGMIVISMLMEKWFTDDCTFATSVCCMGSSFATIGLPTLVVKLVNNLGLQNTFFIHGIFMSIISIICGLVIRNDPREKNLMPYIKKGQKDETTPERAETKYKPVTRKSIIAASLVMATLTGALGGPGWSCATLLVTTSNYSAEVMAVVMTIMSGSMLFGKFLFGWISERITMYKTSIIFATLMVIGLVFMCLLRVSPVLLFTGAALLGGSIGLISIGIVAWVRDWFSEKDRDKYKGIYNLLYCIGSISFSLLPGVIADNSSLGYIPSYIILCGFAICVLVLLLVIYKEARKA